MPLSWYLGSPGQYGFDSKRMRSFTKFEESYLFQVLPSLIKIPFFSRKHFKDMHSTDLVLSFHYIGYPIIFFCHIIWVSTLTLLQNEHQITFSSKPLCIIDFWLINIYEGAYEGAAMRSPPPDFNPSFVSSPIATLVSIRIN